MSSYQSFLFNNVSTISTVESSLRSLTWFLPGRFKDAELASEALSAMLNVMSMYHDTLLARIVKANPKYKPLIPPSLHTRFTRIWLDKNTRYKWIARTLELLRYTELLIEMGLRRKVSRKTRWRVIVLLECIKAILRFALVHITCRPLLSPPIPERDLDPSSLPPLPESATVDGTTCTATPEHIRNNLVPIHPLLTTPRIGQSDAVDYLLPKALETSSVKAPPALVKPLVSPQDWLSESLYILRPFIYVSLLRSSENPNRPLVAMAAIELISRLLRRNPPPSNALERLEYARRDRDILWYLFRGAIWTEHTRPKIESIIDSAARVPVLSLFSSLVKDWIPLIDEYYYYTAP